MCPVTLEVLHPAPGSVAGVPSDPNNQGLVLRLVYGEISFLLAADIEAEAEGYLARTHPDLESDVLKVAHHGSKTSSTGLFLEQVNPDHVVISAGADNRYGHPHPEVVARLAGEVGLADIYETARQGTIEFITNGETLRVETER